VTSLPPFETLKFFACEEEMAFGRLGGNDLLGPLRSTKETHVEGCSKDSSVYTKTLRHLALGSWERKIDMDVETIFISLLRLSDGTVSFSLPGLSNQQTCISAVSKNLTEKHADSLILSESDHRLSNLSLPLPRPSQRPLPRKICFIRATRCEKPPHGVLRLTNWGRRRFRLIWRVFD
jgi:hypothetical protein